MLYDNELYPTNKACNYFNYNLTKYCYAYKHKI